ncbi:ATP-dependent DNA ligase [Zoogloea sp.]|uniref:DNA ligase n=1 Tax=Zoogloea sp. TaxID=49181 RepID=UPI001416A608|nr:MAG: DNA ligase [Zoogloea sp.]
MRGSEGRSWHYLCACLLALFLCGLPARAAPPPLLLAEVLRGEVDLPRYWVSEKLDGARAVWDGRTLRFRSGNPVATPAWFIAGLPAEPLDGELWMGRGRFDALSAAVRRTTPEEAEWRQIRFMVFEQPGGSGTFTERDARLRDIVARAGVPWLQVVEQFRVPDSQALQACLAEVVAGGGEGLMLHRDDAPYVTGRSDVLLKLKPWLDTEARVIGHLPGKGRLAGMLGALRVETPEGRRFNLGSGLPDALRRDPPPVGTQVTYRYTSLTPDGVPRFARFLRVREAF